MKKAKWKHLIAPAVIAAVIAVAYAQVWYESYKRAETYYDEAMGKYAAGQYVSALKGERTLSPDGKNYVFSGGFQQVLETWEHPFALPKPAVFKRAQAKIDEMIEEKMSVSDGEQAFKQFFRLDNRFLDRILIRVRDRYAEQGQKRDALDVYQTVLDAFPMNEHAAAEAKRKIEALGGS